MTQQNNFLAQDISKNFDLYYSALYKYFRYSGADPETANDLAATIFERALLKMRTYDPQKASVKTWLFAIAHNVAANFWRANARRQIVPLDQVTSTSDPSPLIEELIIDHQTVDQLLVALNQLENREREVIALRFAGRLTNSQISGLLGLTESNVGVIVYRSLKQLKAIMSNVVEDGCHV